MVDVKGFLLTVPLACFNHFACLVQNLHSRAFSPLNIDGHKTEGSIGRIWDNAHVGGQAFGRVNQNVVAIGDDMGTYKEQGVEGIFAVRTGYT